MEETRADFPRPSDPLPSDRLIELYVAGECTLAEQAAMARWIAANPGIGAALRTMRTDGEVQASLPSPGAEEWRGLPANPEPGHTSESSSRESRMRNEQDVAQWYARGRRFGSWTIPSSTSLRTPRWWIAVGVGGIIGVTALLRHAPGGSPVSALARTYATQPGERATITLSDGSTVTLAPQTSLVVAPGFGAVNRKVRVTGEAYFDIRKAAGAPFLVHTGNATVRVLGTAFDVTHYPGDRVARVAVVSGKVAVTPTLLGARRVPGGMLVATAGTVARVSDSVVTMSVAEDVAAYPAWARGALTFRETPVLEVLTTIGHWYGYQFRVADSTMANRHLTAVFDGESRGDVLRSLQTLLNVTMEFEGTVVTVRPRHDRPGASRPGRGTGMDSLGTINREVGR